MSSIRFAWKFIFLGFFEELLFKGVLSMFARIGWVLDFDSVDWLLNGCIVGGTETFFCGERDSCLFEERFAEVGGSIGGSNFSLEVE